ncbi:kinase A anchor protein [Mycena latifolia]|nr:kinase A anchor protein [Mycena latifolia]
MMSRFRTSTTALSSGNMTTKARNVDNNAGSGGSPNPETRPKMPPKAKPAKFKPAKARPTHFLSLPLGHHPDLRNRIREFHQKVLPTVDATADVVAIEGLDKSILVDPRRLHFTIGVMTLSKNLPEADNPGTSKAKTVSSAIALLQSLAPEINEITRQPVLLSLEKMGVLKTKGKQAGVLYVGPGDQTDEETIKVARIFELVGQRFRSEGFIDEAPRPSVVLHCTLINASHRKPRRVPRTFSYPEIFERASVDLNLMGPSEVPPAQSDPSRVTTPNHLANHREVGVDFGAWAVSEIQLCEMGSHGPENEYISCASVPVGEN